MVGMDPTNCCQHGGKWGEQNANRMGNCSQLSAGPVKWEYASKLSSLASEQFVVERLFTGWGYLIFRSHMHMETKRLACGRSWQGTFPFPLFPIPFLSNGEIETKFITEGMGISTWPRVWSCTPFLKRWIWWLCWVHEVWPHEQSQEKHGCCLFNSCSGQEFKYTLRW